ncbi:MAG: hypothetical protein OK442_02955 [Thaumarchaeota archaeon]|nr:hypothetical protein [Nitrososphaerota archaeon]
MPQKRDEVVEKVDATQAVPNIYEDWIAKQVKARSASLAAQTEEDEEEDEIDAAEDSHEKAHRRKRGKGSAASNS